MSITPTTRRTTRRALTILMPVAAASALLVACGDDDAPDPSAAGDTEATESMDHGDSSTVADDARHIEVTARSLEFEPSEITVTSSEDIAIVLSSEDGDHDFTVDEFDAHIPADGGETGFGGFRADEPGRYTFYRSVEGHREAGMEGVLVVES